MNRTADIARLRLGIGTVPIIRGPDCPVIAPARRKREDGPLTTQQADNARRYADYIARRQGIKAPLIRLFK
ncbi:hypothetical protein [Halomonas sp. E14]|uniref:hypothetical protein n=1 Tax=Halomonas sp. E14 TaxID=3397245 RepID=UPI00403E61A1